MFNKLDSTLAISILVLLFAANKAGSVQIPDRRDSSLFGAVQRGGYILYLRHGEATIGKDQPGLNFTDCATQRNLSDMGRDQLAAILFVMLVFWKLPPWVVVVAGAAGGTMIGLI